MKIKLPKIHTTDGTVKKMTDDMIEKGMFMLDNGMVMMKPYQK